LSTDDMAAGPVSTVVAERLELILIGSSRFNHVWGSAKPKTARLSKTEVFPDEVG
jgi:hypothetical protein